MGRWRRSGRMGLPRGQRARGALLAGLFATGALLCWLAVTDDVRVWPVRNTLEYHLSRWWWERSGGAPAAGAGAAPGAASGRVRGTVRDTRGAPVAGARVLVTRWDGTVFDAASGPDGGYAIEGVPPGHYVPVAGAPGYADAALGSPWLPWQGVRVPPGGEGRADAVLVAAGEAWSGEGVGTPERSGASGPPEAPERPGVQERPGAPARAAVGEGEAPRLGEAQTLTCDRPLVSRAVRRTATLPRAAGASGQALLYTPAADAPAGAAGAAGASASEAEGAARGVVAPVDAAPGGAAPVGASSGTAAGGGARSAGGGWPLLLTVYPGTAAEWECASLPLAEAGYAVLAAGPSYSFEPDRDVGDLARWLRLARSGGLPEVDGERVALLGGSYSALHVQRLLRRPADLGGVRAVVLLGAPSDLFDARRRLEDGTYVPPFGLDAALIALGFPHREPLRYWSYSGVYHVRRDQPPVALIHSRQDEVVPFQQSEALARQLAAVGAPYRLHVFEAASHYLLSEDGDARAIYELTLDFLGEFLDRHVTPS